MPSLSELGEGGLIQALNLGGIIEQRRRENEQLAENERLKGIVESERVKANARKSRGAFETFGALAGAGIGFLTGGLPGAAFGSSIGQGAGGVVSGKAKQPGSSSLGDVISGGLNTANTLVAAGNQKVEEGKQKTLDNKVDIYSKFSPANKDDEGAFDLVIDGETKYFKPLQNSTLRYTSDSFEDDGGGIWTKVFDKQTGEVSWTKGVPNVSDENSIKENIVSSVPENLNKIGANKKETKNSQAFVNTISALDELEALGEGLYNTDYRILNKTVNEAKAAFGDATVAKFETALTLASKQLASAFEGGRLSDKDFEVYNKALPNLADTQQQRIEKVKILKGLLQKASGTQVNTYNPREVSIPTSYAEKRIGKYKVLSN